MSIFNQTTLRSLILSRLQELRPGIAAKFTRISMPEWVAYLTPVIIEKIENRLKDMPSTGKTIRP